MLILRGADTIRTSRNLKGYRSLAPATGFSQTDLEAGRLAREEERLAGRCGQWRRRRERWRRHFAWVAGPGRVLPPSARERWAAARGH
jgi:hypothetical protein